MSYTPPPLMVPLHLRLPRASGLIASGRPYSFAMVTIPLLLAKGGPDLAEPWWAGLISLLVGSGLVLSLSAIVVLFRRLLGFE
jgi:hypothetical protein